MNTFTKSSVVAGFASLIVVSSHQIASAASADMTEAPDAPEYSTGACGSVPLLPEDPVGHLKPPDFARLFTSSANRSGAAQGPSFGGSNGTICPETLHPQDKNLIGGADNSAVKGAAQLDDIVLQAQALKGKVVDSVVALVKSIEQRPQQETESAVPQGYVLSKPMSISIPLAIPASNI